MRVTSMCKLSISNSIVSWKHVKYNNKRMRIWVWAISKSNSVIFLNVLWNTERFIWISFIEILMMAHKCCWGRCFLRQVSLKLITAQCWNILYNKTLNVVVAMSSKVYSWRKREKRRLKYAMKWKKLLNPQILPSETYLRFFGANWFQDISITYHCRLN